jgi:hypothetical protein
MKSTSNNASKWWCWIASRENKSVRKNHEYAIRIGIKRTGHKWIHLKDTYRMLFSKRLVRTRGERDKGRKHKEGKEASFHADDVLSCSLLFLTLFYETTEWESRSFGFHTFFCDEKPSAYPWFESVAVSCVYTTNYHVVTKEVHCTLFNARYSLMPQSSVANTSWQLFITTRPETPLDRPSCVMVNWEIFDMWVNEKNRRDDVKILMRGSPRHVYLVL